MNKVNLQKLKVFHETEYTIIGFNEGEGTFKGTIIWVCETPDGKQFNATPRGSLDYRKQLFLLGNQYIGKQITIIYLMIFWILKIYQKIPLD